MEYQDVLSRDKFPFRPRDIDNLLDTLIQNGTAVNVAASRHTFIDEDDRAFYEVARHCDAILITGNTKHFPKEAGIVTPAEFLSDYSY
jgi:predicted nucleic acid-binding protein